MAMKFLKTGVEAHKEMEKADLEQEAAFGPQRFWIKEGKEKRITFLDGFLDTDGLLKGMVSFHEHMMPRTGKKGFDNYPCTQDTESCPICEEGDTPSLVFAFTIIDHTEWKDKNDKVHKFDKRLYGCKRDTFKRLQIKATKYGGLAGVTFDVTRIGDKSASVGSDYDFLSQNSIEEIAQGTGLKVEDLKPFNYEETIKYFPAAELRKMGWGNGSASAGQSAGNAVGSADSKVFGGGEKKAEDTGVGTKPATNVFGNKPFDPSKEL